MTACRYTSCVLADSPASFMSSIIRVRIADIVCSFVIDGTTRLDADDSLTSYSSGDAATPPRLRHRRSRPFNRGAFGRAVRTISDAEFDAILRAGFELLLISAPATELEVLEFADEPAAFDRPIVERISSRPFRDAAFSEAVKSAYENTCAVTGLKIINGGGRPEVQAAHIRP